MMESACDFGLLGESVLQVRVSAHTLALLGFFNFSINLIPFFPKNISLFFEHLWREVLSKVCLLALLEQGKTSEGTLEGGASRVRVPSSDDSRVDRIACAGSPSLSRLF